jgi:MFS family permease
VSIQRASKSVAVAFTCAGLALSSFLSRVPQIRDLLDLTPGRLGRVLLMIAIGSMIALPLSGAVVRRFGTRRTVESTAILVVAGIGIAGVGSEINARTVGTGLFLTGFGMGLWDVAMNVEAADIEQRLGRSIMSRYHAAFSLGTVLGALIGAGANKVDIRPAVHLLSVMGFAAVVTTLAARNFLGEPQHNDGAETAHRGAAAAWKEPRTLFIGLLVMSMAFVEGRVPGKRGDRLDRVHGLRRVDDRWTLVRPASPRPLRPGAGVARVCRERVHRCADGCGWTVDLRGIPWDRAVGLGSIARLPHGDERRC